MYSLLFVVSALSIVLGIAMRFFFRDKFNTTECILTAVLSVGLTAAICYTTMFSAVEDTNIINGMVVSKDSKIVPCEHSYQCHCHRIKTGKNTYTTQCSTCYLHPFDKDWDVSSTIGEFTIQRVDSQGLIEPPRWATIKNGDPVSDTDSVVNYILASSGSLFNQSKLNTDAAMYGKYFPEYGHIYDYYRFNHASNMGVPSLNIGAYNQILANSLGVLGTAKHVNIRLVFVPISDIGYTQALERHWLGGKGNDVVVVIGSSNYPKIDFASSFSYGKSYKNEMLNVQISQDVEGLSLDNPAAVVASISKDVAKYYNMQDPKRFKYLMADYSPSTKAYVIGILIYIILMAGFMAIFWFFDIGV